MGVVLPFLNARSLSIHLDLISCKIADGAHAVLILDGTGFHIVKDLKIAENMTLMKLPPYSPELNPIENVCGYRRSNKLSNTVYETYKEIVSACCDAWNFFVNDPERIASITSRRWATVKG